MFSHSLCLIFLQDSGYFAKCRVGKCHRLGFYLIFMFMNTFGGNEILRRIFKERSSSKNLSANPCDSVGRASIFSAMKTAKDKGKHLEGTDRNG